MPFIDAKACRIHYRFDGPETAPVLMMSNSLGTELGVWDCQMPVLTRHFRVLRYDTRGHGQTSATPGPYNIGQLGRDALALLDALGLDRVQFCGLSMGGMIGLWLGINAPERIGRLVLANTGALIGGPAAWNPRIELVTKGGMPAVIGGIIDRWFTPGFRHSAPDQVAAIEAMVLRCPADGYAAGCAAVRDMDLRREAAKITAPTLVVVGASDTATPPEAGHFLAETIPGARLVELPAAHLSVIEAADGFRDSVVPFLTAR